MPAMLRPLLIALCLIAPQAFADALYQIEADRLPPGRRSAVQPASRHRRTGPAGAAPIAGNEARHRRWTARPPSSTGPTATKCCCTRPGQQDADAAPSEAALRTGNEQFGHFPVEGVLSLSEQERLI